jgi:hypothetical protein
MGVTIISMRVQHGFQIWEARTAHDISLIDGIRIYSQFPDCLGVLDRKQRALLDDRWRGGLAGRWSVLLSNRWRRLSDGRGTNR